MSSFPEPSRPLNGGRQAAFPRPQRTWASIQTLHTWDRRSKRACLIVESLRCTHVESCPCKTTFKSQIVTGRPPRAHIPAGTAPPSTPLSSGCPASPARRSRPSRLQGHHPGFSLLVPHLRPLEQSCVWLCLFGPSPERSPSLSHVCSPGCESSSHGPIICARTLWPELHPMLRLQAKHHHARIQLPVLITRQVSVPHSHGWAPPHQVSAPQAAPGSTEDSQAPEKGNFRSASPNRSSPYSGAWIQSATVHTADPERQDGALLETSLRLTTHADPPSLRISGFFPLFPSTSGGE